MFSFFKRPAKVQAEDDFSDTLPLGVSATANHAARPSSPNASPVMDALALEIQEGNEDADWDAWQDSLPYSDRSDTEPSRQIRQIDNEVGINAFDSVRKYSA